MSIAIGGVKGYEYQYKIIAYLALLIGFENNPELFIEIKGQEDATLIIKREKTYNIEIQVKRERNVLMVPKLVEWLCHFEERKPDANLLSRLKDNQSDQILFVTHSRCSDDVVFLKNDISDILVHKKVKYKDNFRESFLKSLKSCKFIEAKSKLGIKRKNFCQSQANGFNKKTTLTDILGKIIIWEEAFDQKIDSSIIEILNKKFKIAQSQTNNTYLSILEKVKEGRDKALNLIPLIKEAIQLRIQGRPIIAKDHFQRSDEMNYIEYLKTNNLLLLTGVSLCGKSELAKKVASYFFDLGFAYKIETEIQELNHFFSSNPEEDKIAILEDPWGHLNLNNEFSEKWDKVVHLSENLQMNHKLIITSRLEIMNKICTSNSLLECKIYGHEWNDLTLDNEEMLVEFWDKFARNKSINNSTVKIVRTSLKSKTGKQLLQVGQLKYLASFGSNAIRNKKITELEHLARQNSNEIARDLRETDSEAALLLSIISLCANTMDGLSFLDLGFIFSSDNVEYSIMVKEHLGITMSSEEAKYPIYSTEYSVTPEVLKHLVFLEERNFIFIKDNIIFLTHPDYYEAGRHLFFSNSTIKQNLFIDLIRKCLYCLNPRTTYLVARQLPFILKNIRDEFKQKIIQIGFYGVSSIYPAVEDSCLVFLSEFFELLTEDEKREVINLLQRGETHSSLIYWYQNEIPYISREKYSNYRLSSNYNTYDQNKFKKFESLLMKNQYVSSFEAWSFLNNWRDKKKSVPKNDVIKSLLLYNEVFIRNRVAFLYFSKMIGQGNLKLTKLLFEDEHSSVIFNAIRGCFIGWKNYNPQFKKLIFRLIKNAFKKQSIAIRANNLITTFAIDYSSEPIHWDEMTKKDIKELWNVWGEIYPIFNKQLPPNVFMHSARFDKTIEDAVKYLNFKNGMNVLIAWYDRIDFKIRSGYTLDEYEMAIADYLIIITKKKYLTRKKLFQKLISYQDTNFILSSLKWIIEYWKELHVSEKKAIINLIKSNRKDLRWIKAVLLNSNSPPKEIVKEILTEDDIFEKDPSYIIKKFPTELLQDCLTVFCGHPQPMWWLAVHHKNEKFWGKLINFILLSNESSVFDVCIRELVLNGVNGFTVSWGKIPDIWKELCEKKELRTILLKRLIYDTSTCSCNISTANKMWSLLIESYIKDNEEEIILNSIITNIEIIQRMNSVRSIIEIFGKDYFFNKIYTREVDEYKIISLLNEIIDISLTSEELINFLNLIFPLIKKSRFIYTIEWIENFCKDLKITEYFLDNLVQIKSNIRSKADDKIKILNLKEDYKLDNWIGQN